MHVQCDRVCYICTCKFHRDPQSCNWLKYPQEMFYRGVENIWYYPSTSPDISSCPLMSLSLPFVLSCNVKKYFHRTLWLPGIERFFSFSSRSTPPMQQRLNPVARYLKVLLQLMVFSHGHRNGTNPFFSWYSKPFGKANEMVSIEPWTKLWLVGIFKSGSINLYIYRYLWKSKLHSPILMSSFLNCFIKFPKLFYFMILFRHL